jgi:hypothetical protein
VGTVTEDALPVNQPVAPHAAPLVPLLNPRLTRTLLTRLIAIASAGFPLRILVRELMTMHTLAVTRVRPNQTNRSSHGETASIETLSVSHAFDHRTGATKAIPPAVKAEIVPNQRVPAFTMRLLSVEGRWTEAPAVILVRRDGFKMGRIDARPNAAKMIKVEAVRNRPDVDFVGQPMRKTATAMLPTLGNVSIPCIENSASP